MVYFSILCFLIGDFAVYSAPSRYSAEVLSSVPESKEAVCCPMEQICVLDKLYLDTSYNAIVL